MPIRVRPDLEARRHRYQGRVYWVVKDPVSLSYFRFEEEEFALLRMLDGESSLDEIARRFEAEFPPQTIRAEELQHFLGTLHRSGLVLTDAPGQGEQLKRRRDERVRKERWGQVSNILSIRFKGIDPEWLLGGLYALPPVRWFFTRTALVLCCLLVAAAASLVAVEFDVFRAKLPSFQTFFTERSWENWLLLGAVVGVTKVLHEFGHGLACKHFGGECHEMGFMLLVLTPCLYCNVSDSWMLPSKWSRAAIGAAGMYVEVVLASICTFVWWFTEPGLLNYTCLNVMFASSVSTILFNANPLLRYDGYYILSDLMEVPNLRQKATTITNRALASWCLGMEQQEDPFLPRRSRWAFALYTVAAVAYRWVVVISIIYFLNKVFEPYGLKPLGQAIALASVWSLLGQPMVGLVKYLRTPGRMAKVKRLPLAATCLLLVSAVAAAILAPLPAYVFTPLSIEPRDAKSVYVEAPGLLREVLVRPGERVQEGQPLARLENIDLQLEIARLEGEVAGYQEEIRALRGMSFSDSTVASQIAGLNVSLASARDRLERKRQDARRLVLRAPVAGWVIPPTYVKPRPHDEKELDTWHGTPLDPENLGATLEPGDRFCAIGDPGRLEARLAIRQSDIDLVAEGQRVRVMLNQSTDLTYAGRVERISRDEMPATPPRLSSLSGGSVPTEMDESGAPRPMEPHFDAVVPLVPPAGADQRALRAYSLLRVGLVGEAKVTIAPRTLWDRFWRYLTRTVNFDL